MSWAAWKKATNGRKHGLVITPVAGRFKIIDNIQPGCNCELWLTTYPGHLLGDKTWRGPCQCAMRQTWPWQLTMSTIKELRPCKMTVYNPNLSRSPITGSHGNTETVMAGHLNQDPWEHRQATVKMRLSSDLIMVQSLSLFCKWYPLSVNYLKSESLTMCLSQKNVELT